MSTTATCSDNISTKLNQKNPNNKNNDNFSSNHPQRKKRKQRRSNHRRLSKSSKIAIIGTGPSGLSAALSLQQAGYQNIRLYERDKHFYARKDGVSCELMVTVVILQILISSYFPSYSTWYLVLDIPHPHSYFIFILLFLCFNLEIITIVMNICNFVKNSNTVISKYGLTLTYNPSMSMSAPLSKLGLLETVARMDCPSRSHYVFDQNGIILGYYGNQFCSNSSNGGHRGFGQRGNLRVPRQCLRKIMMDALIDRDKKEELSDGTDNDVERKGFVQIQWGKKLLSYSQSHRSNVVNENNKNVDNDEGNSEMDGGHSSHLLSLSFDDGSTETADLLIGADGVRSKVMEQVLTPNITSDATQSNIPLSSPSSSSSSGNLQKNKATTDLSYTGIMIVLGITKDFFHPLLDERGFYTLDGEHRLFTMPFEGCRITDLEQLNIPLCSRKSFDSGDNIDDDNVKTTASSKTEKTTTRRYMWQLSYKLASLVEATDLSQRGSQALLEEVLKRTKGWHNPVQQMISSTPLETIWGTPLMDREPNLIHDKIMKEIYNPDYGRTLRTVVLGDSIHAMTPFKGQGCNQALMDGPLLSSWLEKSAIDSAIKGFMREMTQRTNKKVMASRDAATFLHSKQILSHDEDFAGVKKDSVKLLLQTLKERNIGAHLGKNIDQKVSQVIDEFGFYDLQQQSEAGKADKTIEEQKLALKLATSGDIAGIRLLSLSHPMAIRIAKDDITKETCLHLAAKKGYYHSCKWLVSEANVQVDSIDKKGRSPLHAAVISKNLKVISLLAKLSIKHPESWSADVNGRTPIDLAMEYTDKQSMKSVINTLMIVKNMRDK